MRRAPMLDRDPRMHMHHPRPSGPPRYYPPAPKVMDYGHGQASHVPMHGAPRPLRPAMRVENYQHYEHDSFGSDRLEYERRSYPDRPPIRADRGSYQDHYDQTRDRLHKPMPIETHDYSHGSTSSKVPPVSSYSNARVAPAVEMPRVVQKPEERAAENLPINRAAENLPTHPDKDKSERLRELYTGLEQVRSTLAAAHGVTSQKPAQPKSILKNKMAPSTELKSPGSSLTGDVIEDEDAFLYGDQARPAVSRADVTSRGSPTNGQSVASPAGKRRPAAPPGDRSEHSRPAVSAAPLAAPERENRAVPAQGVTASNLRSLTEVPLEQGDADKSRRITQVIEEAVRLQKQKQQIDEAQKMAAARIAAATGSYMPTPKDSGGETDDTLKNILKSIGFDSQVSKLIQEQYGQQLTGGAPAGTPPPPEGAASTASRLQVAGQPPVTSPPHGEAERYRGEKRAESVVDRTERGTADYVTDYGHARKHYEERHDYGHGQHPHKAERSHDYHREMESRGRDDWEARSYAHDDVIQRREKLYSDRYVSENTDRDERGSSRDHREAPRDHREAPRDHREAPRDHREAPREHREAPRDYPDMPRDSRERSHDSREPPRGDYPESRDYHDSRREYSDSRDDRHFASRDYREQARDSQDRGREESRDVTPRDSLHLAPRDNREQVQVSRERDHRYYDNDMREESRSAPPQRESRTADDLDIRRPDRDYRHDRKEQFDRREERAARPPSGENSHMAEKDRLLKEQEARTRRLKGLRSELDRLRDQELDIRRASHRRDTGAMLKENQRLQKDIGQQMSGLRAAQTEGATALRTAAISAEIAERDKVKVNREEVKIRPEDIEVTMEEEKKNRRIEVLYDYFDPGNHWCKKCNSVHDSIKDFAAHLHDDEHKQNADENERPWRSEYMKAADKPKVKGSVCVAPMKGAEFLLPANAIWCRLCKQFVGDAECAEIHIKSKEHNDKYQEHVEEFPFYEKNLTIERSTASVNILKPEKKEHGSKVTKVEKLKVTAGGNDKRRVVTKADEPEVREVKKIKLEPRRIVKKPQLHKVFEDSSGDESSKSRSRKSRSPEPRSRGRDSRSPRHHDDDRHRARSRSRSTDRRHGSRGYQEKGRHGGSRSTMSALRDSDDRARAAYGPRLPPDHVRMRSRSPGDRKRQIMSMKFRGKPTQQRDSSAVTSRGRPPPRPAPEKAASLYKRAQKAMAAKSKNTKKRAQGKKVNKSPPKVIPDTETFRAIKTQGLAAVLREREAREERERELRELGIEEDEPSVTPRAPPPVTSSAPSATPAAASASSSQLHSVFYSSDPGGVKDTITMDIEGGLEEIDDDDDILNVKEETLAGFTVLDDAD